MCLWKMVVIRNADHLHANINDSEICHVAMMLRSHDFQGLLRIIIV
jgi:hypothetical protein